MDIAGASLGLLLLCPLLLSVAVLIKLTSRGPVFYRQERFGVQGRRFRIWKFRSMHVGSNPVKHQQHVRRLLSEQRTLEKVDGSYKMISLGRWLRLLAIDELPQLLNVLAGEMSLVGPRPDVIPPEEYPLWQRARFDVLPGLSGLWQVSGKNKTTFEEMVRLDIRYIQRRSPWLDLKIVVLTGPAILRQVLEDRRPGATAATSGTRL
jgi:lipopolysaccharide/colanic/teichoic acid biosynthesis glycosyltransferase